MADPEIDDALDEVLDDSLWSLGVYDAHCHPTDTMDVVPEIPKRKVRTLTIMATKAEDQELVAQVAREYPDRIVPSFGWHPWFSHRLWDDMKAGAAGVTISKEEHYRSVLTNEPTEAFIEALPEPKPLSQFITETRNYLEEFPSALVGEVGLDRTFRLPNPASLIGPDDKKLSPHKVQMDHQRRVLEEQLRLAGEMERPASVHGVSAHGVLFDTFSYLFKGHEKVVRSKRTQKRGPHDFEGDEDSDEDTGPKPFPPRICLHSFSAPPDFIKTWLNPKIPAKIYFSFSKAINVGYGYERFAEMLGLVPEDRLLVESDLHIASIDMERHLAGIIHRISRERLWDPSKTVETTGRNWINFVYGETASKALGL